MNDGDFERLTRNVRALTGIIARIAHTTFEQQLNQSDIGVSAVQFAVMHSLCHGQHTISELSRKFVVDPSTLVPIIDTLERKGLVERTRDPNDRRRVPVSLTESGVHLLRRDLPVSHDDPFYLALTAMGAERAQHLHDLLIDVLKALPGGDQTLEAVQSRLNLAAGARRAHPAAGHGHEQNHLHSHHDVSDTGKA